jgi:hypothetical protein
MNLPSDDVAVADRVDSPEFIELSRNRQFLTGRAAQQPGFSGTIRSSRRAATVRIHTMSDRLKFR